jgi:hypothetical protein
MDEQVARQLTRQLKIINFWITFFGTIIVVTLLILGFFIFKMVMFVTHFIHQPSRLLYDLLFLPKKKKAKSLGTLPPSRSTVDQSYNQ